MLKKGAKSKFLEQAPTRMDGYSGDVVGAKRPQNMHTHADETYVTVRRKKLWVFVRGQKCVIHIDTNGDELQQVKDFVWQSFQVNYYDMYFYDEARWHEIYGGPRDEEVQFQLVNRRRMAFTDEPIEDLDQQVSDQSDGESVCDNPPADDEHMEVAHTHTPALRAAALG